VLHRQSPCCGFHLAIVSKPNPLTHSQIVNVSFVLPLSAKNKPAGSVNVSKDVIRTGLIIEQVGVLTFTMRLLYQLFAKTILTFLKIVVSQADTKR